MSYERCKPFKKNWLCQILRLQTLLELQRVSSFSVSWVTPEYFWRPYTVKICHKNMARLSVLTWLMLPSSHDKAIFHNWIFGEFSLAHAEVWFHISHSIHTIQSLVFKTCGPKGSKLCTYLLTLLQCAVLFLTMSPRTSAYYLTLTQVLLKCFLSRWKVFSVKPPPHPNRQTLQKLETNKCQQAADMHIKLVRHILYLYQPSLSGHHQLELTDGLVRWSYLISVALLLSKLSRAAQSSADSQSSANRESDTCAPKISK